MTQLAALNIKISGDSADLQADLAKARDALNKFEREQGKGQKGADKFSGSLAKLGNVSGQTRAQIQNTSFQLQDIAVQLQGGTRASTVFAQQLPQLLGGFGAVGAAVGVLAAVGIPALAFAFADAGEEAVTFEDRLSELKDMQEQLISATKILNMDVDELEQRYGSASEAVRAFAVAQAEGLVSQARRSLQDEILIIDDFITRYSTATQVMDEFGSESEDIGQSLRNLRDDLGVNAQEAGLLFDAFKALDDAATFDEQQAAMARIDELLKAANVSADQLPEELNTSLIAMRNLVFEAEALEQAIQNIEDAANKVNTGVPLFMRGLTGNQLLPPTSGDDDNGGGGRARKDPLIGELERLEQSLMSQEELEIASNERRQEVLRQALEQKYLTQQEFDALAEEEAARHNDALEQLDRQRQQAALQGFSGMFGDLASLMQSSNDKLFKIGKAAAIAEAVVNGYSSAVAAWEKGMKIGGPPVAAAFAGASLAKTGALISSIKSTSSGGAGGGASGAVGGASATSGAVAAQAAPQTSNQVAISLTGGDMFSRDQVIQLINGINDAVDDGAQIRLV